MPASRQEWHKSLMRQFGFSIVLLVIFRRTGNMSLKFGFGIVRRKECVLRGRLLYSVRTDTHGAFHTVLQKIRDETNTVA